MKYLLLLLIIICLANCNSPKKSDSPLIGKWQAMEYLGSDGARDFKKPIDNGDILTFIDDQHVLDKNEIEGRYYIQRDSMCIEFPDREVFYRFNLNGTKQSLELAPVDSNYGIICDEGCAFVYYRK